VLGIRNKGSIKADLIQEFHIYFPVHIQYNVSKIVCWRKKVARSFRKTITILTLTLFVLTASLIAFYQDDAEKKYAPLIGDYEFDMQGQIMIVSFWVEEGQLWGAPEGETPEELEPVEGEDLKFEINTADGQFMELEFVKDESGKVTKCIVLTMGMELEGLKIK
jgi:hypothetical protein